MSINLLVFWSSCGNDKLAALVSIILHIVYIEIATFTEHSATFWKCMKVKVAMVNDFWKLCKKIYIKIRNNFS